MMLSDLSIPFCQSALCFLGTGDVSMSCFAVRALCFQSGLCQQQTVCKRHCQLAQARAETDQFTLLQLYLQQFNLGSNWT